MPVNDRSLIYGMYLVLNATKHAHFGDIVLGGWCYSVDESKYNRNWSVQQISHVGDVASRHHAMLRCCCCLLLHAMTRAARAASPLMWEAQNSVWALVRFGSFVLPPLNSAAPNEHVFTSQEASSDIF